MVFTESQILKAKKPGDIFTNDQVKIKDEYRKLIKKYHPDANPSPNADEVIQKLSKLYAEGCKAIKNNTWEKSNFIKINKAGKGAIEITFQAEKKFELGTYYICNTHIIYLFDKGKEKFKDNMLKFIKKVKYRDGEMEKVFKRCMPVIKSTFKTEDGRSCVVLEKTSDVLPLDDVLNYYGGKMEPRHIAWILSRIHNLCCFLKYNNIVLNGFSLENCFISPEYHSVCLFGGWWYAAEEKNKMIGTSKEIFNVMPVIAKTSKTAEYTTDLESIKLLGRKLAGNTNCRLLKKECTAPAQIIDFLTEGSGKDPVKEFQKWDKALDGAYGTRKFVPMNITKNNLY